MARIPTAADAGLGEQIARGPRLSETQIPRGAFGGGIGEAMQHPPSSRIRNPLGIKGPNLVSDLLKHSWLLASGNCT